MTVWTSDGLEKLKEVVISRIVDEINSRIESPGPEPKSLAAKKTAELRRYIRQVTTAGGVEPVLEAFDAAMDPATSEHWQELIKDLVRAVDGGFFPAKELKPA